jgi:hypothetical protein
MSTGRIPGQGEINMFTALVADARRAIPTATQRTLVASFATGWHSPANSIMTLFDAACAPFRSTPTFVGDTVGMANVIANWAELIQVFSADGAGNGPG